MKKIAIVVLFVCGNLIGYRVLHAQDIKMRVTMNDGSVLSFSVDSITKITFAKLDTFPKYSVMDLVCPVEIPDVFTIDCRAIDSIIFGKDISQRDILAAYPRPPWWLDSTFHLIGPMPDRAINPDAPIDSISFGSYEVDTNVADYFPFLASSLTGYISSVWNGNRIYVASPVSFFDLDSNLDISRDSVLDSTFANRFNLALNDSASRLLYVNSYLNYNSIGNLVEYNLGTGGIEVIDTAHQISSAVYFPGTDNIVYYAYGSYSDTGKNPNTNPADAGYYLLDRSTGIRTLLLHYISTLGINESVNGFDISPDGKKLLFGSTGSRAPLAIEYDLATHVSDTLNVFFDPMYDRLSLWLRYSHDGSKILYDNYALGAVYSVEYEPDQSEIGIIDRATLTKQVLDTSPDNEEYYVSLFPQWSPDDTRIVYSLSQVSEEPPGTTGYYSLRILKSLH